jgi:transposase
MAYIGGESREQTAMFPVTLDELIPSDHVCRVIEAFVARLKMVELGFLRATPAETGRPGYDPRDLLKLYLYGYLQQVRSSRRLEAECRRNVEVMWLLRGVQPDYKSIAEFRRMHNQAVMQAGAELVRVARSVGLVKGETVAVDGTKFRAVSSAQWVRERNAMKRYLEQLDMADEQANEILIDASAVPAALEKLKQDPEPEVGFMRTPEGKRPAYNVQTAVDAEHALIVAQQVTSEGNDQRSLLPMALAAKQALGSPEALNIVADAGYANGEQAAACEAQGLLPHVPRPRRFNNQGDGQQFEAAHFHYDQDTDTFRCPAGQTLRRQQPQKDRRRVVYAAAVEVCGACPLKPRCTQSARRSVRRHLYEDALRCMQQRATAEMMRLRRSTVEHPFASLKYHIFGHPRFLLRGLVGAQTEINLASMVYNLKRMLNVLGGSKLREAMAG